MLMFVFPELIEETTICIRLISGKHGYFGCGLGMLDYWTNCQIYTRIMMEFGTKFLNSYFNCLITMMLPANFVLSKHWTHSKNSLDIDSIPWKHFYRPECQFLSLARYALCLLLTYILEIARNSLKRKN